MTAVALAAVGSAAFALTIFVARTDIPWATAELRGRVGPGDVVVSPVAEYLLVVYYGDAATAAQAHVVGGPVPAYWGTAAFPDGAVVSALPAGTATVHVLDYPGRTPARPSGHRLTAATCGRGICLYTFDR